jgi:hypothetical protein
MAAIAAFLVGLYFTDSRDAEHIGMQSNSMKALWESYQRFCLDEDNYGKEVRYQNLVSNLSMEIQSFFEKPDVEFEFYSQIVGNDSIVGSEPLARIKTSTNKEFIVTKGGSFIYR